MGGGRGGVEEHLGWAITLISAPFEMKALEVDISFLIGGAG